MVMMMIMLFLLLQVSLNLGCLIFIIHVDFQPADLAVVEKQKSIQLLFLPEADNKVWGKHDQANSYCQKQLFPLGCLAEAGQQAGSPMIAKARRALVGMKVFGIFPSWLSCSPISSLSLSFTLGPDLLLSTVSKIHLELFPQRYLQVCLGNHVLGYILGANDMISKHLFLRQC